MNKRESLQKLGISEETIDWLLDSSEFYRPDRSPMRSIPVEVYSRVVGYFRPVGQWNNGKREEFRDRREYSMGGGRYIPDPTEG